MPEQSGPESGLVINNARLFDGLEVHDGFFSVGISGKTIDSVTAIATKAKKEIDAAGRFLMPGLIDCHIHLNDFFHVADETAMAAYLDQELPGHLMEFISAGVTSIKSVGDPEDHILQTRDRLANGNLRGPRLFVTGPCFTARESHPATTVYGQNPWYRQRAAVETDSPAEARDVVRRLAERRVDAIKIVHHGGCRGHGAPYYLTIKQFNWHAQMFKLPRAVLEAIIDEAHKCGLKATVHTFDEDAAISVLEAGADGLEHGVVNQRLSSDRLIELLQKNHATYVPTLWILGSELTYANLKEVADAGVRIALGTDTFCGHGKFGENTIVEAERAAQAGIAPVRVLRMATKDAAEHLGADMLGMIAPGRFADLLLVDGDPTANISALRNVSMVMKNGEILIDKLSGLST
jgi:imidazolonepropionase-like amidohydrolase